MNTVNFQKDEKLEKNNILNIIFYSKDSDDTAQKIKSHINELDLNFRNEIGDNLLMIAARKNMGKVCSVIFDFLLLKNEINYLIHQNNDGENLLMILVKRNNIELFEKLISNEKTSNMIEHKRKGNKNVVSFIKDYGHTNMLKLLEEQEKTNNKTNKM